MLVVNVSGLGVPQMDIAARLLAWSAIDRGSLESLMMDGRLR